MDIADIDSLRNEHIVLVKDFDLREHPIRCQQRILDICKENVCGNYDKCWTCPPNAPPIEECQRQISGFKRLAIYKMSFPVRDIRDPEEIRDLLRKSQGIVRSVRDEADSKDIMNLSLAGGACLYCDECTYPGTPCRHPEKALNSNDSYALDLASYVESVGLSFKRNDGEAIFFGMMFHDRGGSGDRKHSRKSEFGTTTVRLKPELSCCGDTPGPLGADVERKHKIGTSSNITQWG